MNPRPIQVILYTRPGCHLCDDARAVLEELSNRCSLEIEEIDITSDPQLVRRYDILIPVVHIEDGPELIAPIVEADLRRALQEAARAGVDLAGRGAWRDEPMRATEIKGLPVRPANSGEATGIVTDLVLDLELRRIVALLVLREEDGTTYALGVEDVQHVGDDAIGTLEDTVLVPIQYAHRYDGLPTLGRIVDEKAITESGKIVGKLTDIEVDERTWKVMAYDVVSSVADALEHGERRVPAETVRSTGAHMLLVADALTER